MLSLRLHSGLCFCHRLLRQLDAGFAVAFDMYSAAAEMPARESTRRHILITLTRSIYAT